MKNFFYCSAILILWLFSSCTPKQQEFTCILKGVVVDRPESRELILTKTIDNELSGNSVIIPIVDGKFETQFTAAEKEGYQLIFVDERNQGRWMSIDLVAEEGVIEFTLHPMDRYEENVIKGGVLNDRLISLKSEMSAKSKEMFRHHKQQKSAVPEDNYYSEEGKAVYAELRAVQDPIRRSELYKMRDSLEANFKIYSEEMSVLQKQGDSLGKQYRNWVYELLGESPDEASLCILLRENRYSSARIDLQGLTTCVDKHAEKLKNNGSILLLTEKIEALNNIKVGGRYIDFEAPTVDGEMERLSDHIEGKVALIDLWASWCGPCRTASKSMIPLYEKYKDKGFTVVGVACEYTNADNFKTAVEKDQYPWLNLIDVDYQHRIWYKYGLFGAAGKTILVNGDGTILALDVDAKQVETILANLL